MKKLTHTMIRELAGRRQLELRGRRTIALTSSATSQALARRGWLIDCALSSEARQVADDELDRLGLLPADHER